MNTLDIILLAMAGISMIYGLKTGLVKQLTLGAGVIIGLLQATIFYQQAGYKIYELSGWDSWICNTLGFIAILLAVAIVINVAGLLLRWLLKIILLGWIDRILGALFSIFVGIAILVFAVKISNNIFPDNKITGETEQQESLLYNKVADITSTIIEDVKEEVKDEMEID